jgi:hypothetical protein
LNRGFIRSQAADGTEQREAIRPQNWSTSDKASTALINLKHKMFFKWLAASGAASAIEDPRL